MTRIVFIILRIFYRMPMYLWQVHKRKKGNYSIEDNIIWTRNLIRYVLPKSRVDLTITGQENIPSEGAFLFTPNHQGVFDVLAFFKGVDRPFKVIYKKELTKVKVLKDVLAFNDYPFIDRSNLRQSMKVIKKATKELQEGMPYLIFPEGTRSRKQNEILEFKGGSFKCAIDAKVPIIPCALIDCFKVFDEKGIKRVSCSLHILKPLEYETYKDLSSSEIAKKVHDLIEEEIQKHA